MQSVFCRSAFLFALFFSEFVGGLEKTRDSKVVVATRVVGMGFAYGLGRFLKKCNPRFADPSPFVYFFLKFQGGPGN